MAKHEVLTTDDEIEAAFERAKLHDNEPLARTVEHIPSLRLLIVGLTNGRRLILPVEDLQGLGAATDAQLQKYELYGRGTGIAFPDIDVDLYVPALIKGIYGNRRWMEQLERRGNSSAIDPVVGSVTTSEQGDTAATSAR